MIGRFRKWLRMQWRLKTGNKFVVVSYNCHYCNAPGTLEIEKKFTIEGRLHPLIRPHCGKDGCVQFTLDP